MTATKEEILINQELSKSDKMRALYDAGVTAPIEIASLLGAHPAFISTVIRKHIGAPKRKKKENPNHDIEEVAIVKEEEKTSVSSNSKRELIQVGICKMNILQALDWAKGLRERITYFELLEDKPSKERTKYWQDKKDIVEHIDKEVERIQRERAKLQEK